MNSLKQLWYQVNYYHSSYIKCNMKTFSSDSNSFRKEQKILPPISNLINYSIFESHTHLILNTLPHSAACLILRNLQGLLK